MRGLDANVVLRWLVNDESSRDQSERAARVIDEGGNHLSTIALAETVWVLERTYKVQGSNVRAIVASMLELETLKVAEPELVREAIRDHELHGGGLNDHLIAAHDRAAGCDYTLTFDKKAARSKRFRLV